MTTPRPSAEAKDAAPRDAEAGSDTCTNGKCKCSACTCGASCTCGVSPRVVCDPCVSFKAALEPGGGGPPGLQGMLVMFGDSLTQHSFEDGGFGAHLSHVYARRLDVINRGFSGYNTRWARGFLEKVFPTGLKAQLVLVFFGANDASLVEHNPRQHVPLEEYGENLIAICTHVRETCCDRILLVTPPPVCHEQRLAHQKQWYKDAATGILERTNETAGKYAQRCVEAGDAIGVPVCNLWAAMQKEDGWESMLSDGLHFSRRGQHFVGRALAEAVETAFPELAVTPSEAGAHHNSGSTSQLRHFLPWHDQIAATKYPGYRE